MAKKNMRIVEAKVGRRIMKKSVKYIAMVVLIILSIGILNGCKYDYGYEYHFEVVGGNGAIVFKVWEATRDKWEYYESPLFMLGSKEGSHNLEFLAEPDEGYQVKEWTYNGVVVDGNKSNTFTTGYVTSKQPIITITVEFEPIGK